MEVQAPDNVLPAGPRSDLVRSDLVSEALPGQTKREPDSIRFPLVAGLILPGGRSSLPCLRNHCADVTPRCLFDSRLADAQQVAQSQGSTIHVFGPLRLSLSEVSVWEASRPIVHHQRAWTHATCPMCGCAHAEHTACSLPGCHTARMADQHSGSRGSESQKQYTKFLAG